MSKKIVSWFGVILGLVGLTTVVWGVGSAAGSFGSSYGTLELVGQFALPNETHDVVVNGNYVYLAEYEIGVHIVDVSNPAEPAEVAFVPLTQASDVAILENYLYLTGYDFTDGWGVYILDISDPANPIQVNVLPGKVGTTISGSFAYMAGVGGFLVMDMSNPAAPVEVGSVVIPEDPIRLAANGATAMAVTGRSVCIPAPDHPSSINNGMWVIDVSNPTAPAVASFVHSGTESWQVAAGDGYCYLGKPGWGVQIIDVSNPYQPYEIYFSTGMVSTLAWLIIGFT